MQASLELIGVATVLFGSTNLDDVFLLVSFFADPRLRRAQIMAGQYLAMGVLYGASVIASLVSLVIPDIYIGLLGLIPIAIGLAKLRNVSPDDDDDELPRQRGGTFAVAAVTIASGGDNIAVYTPVFATQDVAQIFVIGLVFAILVWAWVSAAGWLTLHPSLGAPIRRYGRSLVPFVLIGVGLWVLYEGGAHQLLIPGEP